ncbi:Calponin homology domain [Phytophthora cactorum]|nr:Calponin homology domain [Phytophthora cactorum]
MVSSVLCRQWPTLRRWNPFAPPPPPPESASLLDRMQEFANRELLTSRALLTDFQDFIQQGNMIDMAVGLILGSSFSAILDSLVVDIINFVYSTEDGAVTINYGLFVENAVTFLINAVFLFFAVKKVFEVVFKRDVLVKKQCPYCKEFQSNRMPVEVQEEDSYVLPKDGSLNVVFAFMQKKNVSVTNIDSSDILDGNNKLFIDPLTDSALHALEPVRCTTSPPENVSLLGRVQELASRELITTRALLTDFQEFIQQGNMLNMAVGLILGSSFSAILNSLFILILVFHDVARDAGAVTINYGLFIENVMNFIINALFLFLAVKKALEFVFKLKVGVKKQCPYCKEFVKGAATRCKDCGSDISSQPSTGG